MARRTPGKASLTAGALVVAGTAAGWLLIRGAEPSSALAP